MIQKDFRSNKLTNPEIVFFRMDYTPNSSSSISSPSRILSPSRIMSPSRIPSPKTRAIRIPSAPRYQPPTRAIEPPPAPSPSPPPPPPPSELYNNSSELESVVVRDQARDTESIKFESFQYESIKSESIKIDSPKEKSRETTPLFASPPPGIF